MTELTLEHAKRILETAYQKAVESKLDATIAVVDAGGHLLALQRMDGALLASLESAQVKARTAVFFGAPTRFLPGDKPFTPALLGAVSYPVAMVPGGVPIRAEGRIIGAIGVGGGSSDQDDAVAEAGAAQA